jgi:hypothetical protein
MPGEQCRSKNSFFCSCFQLLSLRPPHI